jgi:acyl carrier protein
MPNIEQEVRSYIAANILFSGDDFPYDDDASFLGEGIIDSMNVLELVSLAETRFGVTVDDQDIVPANFDSVAKLAAYIRRKGGLQSTQVSQAQTSVAGA